MEYIKILIVDDIPTNIALIATIIKRLNAEYETATNGMEALRKVEEQKPNIILLDLMMPGMDGWEIIRRIREKHTKDEIAIIVTSAITDQQAVNECRELGVNDYIAKPIIPNQLLDIIQLNALKII